MAQSFKETAHLHVNKQKYDEGYDRIFGKKDSDKEESEEEKIQRILKEHFKEEEMIKTWLRSPNGGLGGSAPNELIASGRAHKVLAFIQSIAEGY